MAATKYIILIFGFALAASGAPYSPDKEDYEYATTGNYESDVYDYPNIEPSDEGLEGEESRNPDDGQEEFVTTVENHTGFDDYPSTEPAQGFDGETSRDELVQQKITEYVKTGMALESSNCINSLSMETFSIIFIKVMKEIKNIRGQDQGLYEKIGYIISRNALEACISSLE